MTAHFVSESVLLSAFAAVIGQFVLMRPTGNICNEALNEEGVRRCATNGTGLPIHNKDGHALAES
jgi:hypothetical protein